MRANLAALCLSIFAGATVLSAQTVSTGKPVDYSHVYCSGFVSDPKVPDDIRVISGEQSNYKIAWDEGEYIYINRGADKDVKVGDRFAIVRPDHDQANEWFYGQKKLERAMGTVYKDAAQVRVVSVHAKVAIAKVEFSCGYVLRGDIARPQEERPAPVLKEVGAFDHFAAVSGKPVGTIVTSRDYPQLLGRGDTMFVNVGAEKGVKVGDYLRVFRYQGTRTELTSEVRGYQYKMEGYGSALAHYEPQDLPREVLGEGIVLNVTRNAATVLITYNNLPLYTGDFVEIE